MEAKLEVRTETKRQWTLNEFDLVIAIEEFLRKYESTFSTELDVNDLDWDIRQGELMKGVTVTVVEVKSE